MTFEITSAWTQQAFAPCPSNQGTSFKVSPSFFNCKWLDFSEKDIFTQMSFEELKNRQADVQMPFFLAITRDKKGAIHMFDAASLINYRTKYQKVDSPFSRQVITEGMIYKFDSNSNSLQSFCSLDSIDQNDSHFIMSILAADLDLSPEVRGKYRFYLGGFYYHVEHDLKNAEFWYLKSIEDQYFAAHISFADWYERGEVFQQSDNKCLEELYKALELSPAEEREKINQIVDKKKIANAKNDSSDSYDKDLMS